jgi:hypothetical protein
MLRVRCSTFHSAIGAAAHEALTKVPLCEDMWRGSVRGCPGCSTTGHPGQRGALFTRCNAP